jgi:DNA helicase-2/ATP-dependent DNA helicase PcrA
MRSYRLEGAGRTGALDYEGQLNPAQREAVLAGDGPQLVIAGAGSGKTRMLTYRVAHLIERGLPASGVVLCTFTNKAAREMLARVEHLVGGEVRQVFGGTFHHLANRLLRSHAREAGLSPAYSILDQEDAHGLLGDCLAAESAGRRAPVQPAVLGELLGLSINTRTPLEALVQAQAPALADRLPELVRAAEAYRARKRTMDALDFDDLLELLRSLLEEQPALAEAISGRCLHVLVDEYQDTTPLQVELVDRLAAVHRNLTVVGDDAQTIYGFRGASPRAILGFAERWPGTRLHKLETNYRSTPQVLELANAAIRANRHQIPKTLEPARPPGARPALVPVTDGDVQARFVAQRVLELVAQGWPLSELAALYRAHHHSMELQLELTRRGIPYLVRSGVRFFEAAHVKDVLAFLRLVANPRDELAWLRALRLQPGLGRQTAQRLWDALGASQEPLGLALAPEPPVELTARARTGWEALRAILVRLDEPAARASASVAIEAVLASGYQAQLAGLYPRPEERLEDLVQLARWAERFEGPRAFLAELSLLGGFGAEEVLSQGEPGERMTLSSIHQAKGLEWRGVFVLALEEGAFPHPRAALELDGLEEERRLFYVAVTRAKDELYLLCRQVDDRPGRRQTFLRPSRFLREVDDGRRLERWNVSQG